VATLAAVVEQVAVTRVAAIPAAGERAVATRAAIAAVWEALWVARSAAGWAGSAANSLARPWREIEVLLVIGFWPSISFGMRS
jgi:hypothetical protein